MDEFIVSPLKQTGSTKNGRAYTSTHKDKHMLKSDDVKSIPYIETGFYKKGPKTKRRFNNV